MRGNFPGNEIAITQNSKNFKKTEITPNKTTSKSPARESDYEGENNKSETEKTQEAPQIPEYKNSLSRYQQQKRKEKQKEEAKIKKRHKRILEKENFAKKMDSASEMYDLYENIY
jgi:tRNA nucleotidyltransferase/poly(A) polymerase